MNIKIFEHTEELARYFANLLIKQLGEIDKNDFYSIALSGGSTPKAVFKVFATEYKEKINWSKIHIFWGDERCVDPEDNESNYKMTRENLLNHIPIPETNIFRIHGENKPELESVRYSEIVKKNVRIVNGIPQFDLIMLGLGEDGHTASIFPNQTHLFESEMLFEATQNPYNKQNRITATGKFINHAAMVVFLVTGSAKADMVESIINNKKEAINLPSSMVKPLNNKVCWFLDKNAAIKIKSNL
jgi:6-phosphogluconolactonase